MNLQKLIFTNNNCYKAGKTIVPKGVMVHSTGASNPELRRYVGPDDGKLGYNKNKNHWNQPTPDDQQKCAHAFIGKLENGSIASYQVLPWSHRGWHCGSGKLGSGNDRYISIEICEDGLTDSGYFNKVYQEAVELTAYLCKQYGLNPEADGVVICHSEGHARGIASNHGDVMHWFPRHAKNMDTFRSAVAAATGAVTNNNSANSSSNTSSNTSGLPNLSAYKGSSIVDGLKSVGYDSSLASRKALATKLSIANYTGTAAQNSQMLSLLRSGSGSNTSSSTSGLPDLSGYKGSSIVDGLKSIGYDSSFQSRKTLATKLGIPNYTGTAAQNSQMLSKLR